jgi:hypothetical protein
VNDDFTCKLLFQVDAPLDPVKELGKLITERKFDEAFTLALQRSDVSIVSWLCSQVSSCQICCLNFFLPSYHTYAILNFVFMNLG